MLNADLCWLMFTSVHLYCLMLAHVTACWLMLAHVTLDVHSCWLTPAPVDSSWLILWIHVLYHELMWTYVDSCWLVLNDVECSLMLTHTNPVDSCWLIFKYVDSWGLMLCWLIEACWLMLTYANYASLGIKTRIVEETIPAPFAKTV